MRIAIIDDGVNKDKYHLEDDIEINENLDISPRIDKQVLHNNHGTICGGIIKKYAPRALLSSVKILDSVTGRSCKEQLIEALYWCAENRIKIVNLSIGSTNYHDFEELKSCVNEVVGQGLIIIAACNNRNIYTVPACLTNVIGVSSKSIYEKNTDYWFDKYSLIGIDVYTSGRHFIDKEIGCSPASNSFAAPFVTAKVSEILDKNPNASLEEVKVQLYKNAMNYYNDLYNPFLCVKMDWFDNKSELMLEEYTDIINIQKSKHIQYKKDTASSIVLPGEKKEYKFWDSITYKEELIKIIGNTTAALTIPIISFKDSEIGIINKIKKMFIKDNYYPVVVTGDLNGMVYGYDYYPKDVDFGKFMAYIQQKYDCDLILFDDFHGQLDMASIEASYVDIEISASPNEPFQDPIFVKEAVHEFYKFNLGHSPDKEVISLLYKKVKKIFE